MTPLTPTPKYFRGIIPHQKLLITPNACIDIIPPFIIHYATSARSDSASGTHSASVSSDSIGAIEMLYYYYFFTLGINDPEGFWKKLSEIHNVGVTITPGSPRG